MGLKNQALAGAAPLTRERAVQLLKDAFVGATEREISTGDAVHIYVIDATGVAFESMPLRRD